MNMFGIYISLYFIKIYSKTHQIAPFKKILGGTCPRTPKQSRGSATRRMPLCGTQLAPPKLKKILHTPMLKCRADHNFEVDFEVNDVISMIVTKWDLILFIYFIVIFLSLFL